MRFKANEKKLMMKRQELRETLRQRFNNMQQHKQQSDGTEKQPLESEMSLTQQ